MYNSKPNIFPSLRPLLTIISSPQTNDEISAQLAELLGFNEIALAVDILENRWLVKEKVRRYIVLGNFSQSAHDIQS